MILLASRVSINVLNDVSYDNAQDPLEEFRSDFSEMKTVIQVCLTVVRNPKVVPLLQSFVDIHWRSNLWRFRRGPMKIRNGETNNDIRLRYVLYLCRLLTSLTDDRHWTALGRNGYVVLTSMTSLTSVFLTTTHWFQSPLYLGSSCFKNCLLSSCLLFFVDVFLMTVYDYLFLFRLVSVES